MKTNRGCEMNGKKAQEIFFIPIGGYEKRIESADYTDNGDKYHKTDLVLDVTKDSGSWIMNIYNDIEIERYNCLAIKTIIWEDE